MEALCPINRVSNCNLVISNQNMTPRTELTRELEKYNLQYFQWFYIERKSIKQVTNAFNKLFKDIALVTNEQHHFE